MRRSSSTSRAAAEQTTSAFGQRDLRATPERRKKLEQQVMESESMRETRSRRSTAGKKPIRLMDAGVLHTKRQRKSSSTNSVSTTSTKDIAMTASEDMQDAEKPKEVVRMRRLGVLRTVDSPVKRKGSARGRPPKMIHRQVEPNQDSTENASTNDDVFESSEQMTSSSTEAATEGVVNDDGGSKMETVERETTASSETADIQLRDRKEVTEHESPRDIGEASDDHTGGSSGTSPNDERNSTDETKVPRCVENSSDEASMQDDSEAVLRGNANKSRQPPTGAPGMTPTSKAEDDDIITTSTTTEANTQGHMLAAGASDLGDSESTLNDREGEASRDGVQQASEDGVQQASSDGVQQAVSYAESQGSSQEEGNSDSGGSDRWETLQRAGDSDGDDGNMASDLTMKTMQVQTLEGVKQKVSLMEQPGYSSCNIFTPCIRHDL